MSSKRYGRLAGSSQVGFIGMLSAEPRLAPTPDFTEHVKMHHPVRQLKDALLLLAGYQACQQSRAAETGPQQCGPDQT